MPSREDSSIIVESLGICRIGDKLVWPYRKQKNGGSTVSYIKSALINPAQRKSCVGSWKHTLIAQQPTSLPAQVKEGTFLLVQVSEGSFSLVQAKNCSSWRKSEKVIFIGAN